MSTRQRRRINGEHKREDVMKSGDEEEVVVGECAAAAAAAKVFRVPVGCRNSNRYKAPTNPSALFSTERVFTLPSAHRASSWFIAGFAQHLWRPSRSSNRVSLQRKLFYNEAPADASARFFASWFIWALLFSFRLASSSVTTDQLKCTVSSPARAS